MCVPPTPPAHPTPDEYEKGYYPSKRFQARHGLRPKHRCGSLADFRQRYACYRTGEHGRWQGFFD